MMQSTNLRDSVDRRGTTKGRRAFWAYIIIGMTFLALEGIGSGVPASVRSLASDIAAPILTILEQPIRAVQDGIERLAGVSDIYVENQSLRDENERLKQWRDAALQLSRENERYKTILKAPGREVPTAATGRVVGTSGGAFEQSIVIDVGSAQGVKRDFPALDESGVIGRVIGVGYYSSRILLVTDVNSHIPVRLERTGDLAILEGTNDLLFKIRYLPDTVQLLAGDRFLTSGHGGVFPPDLPIASVKGISDGNALVEAAGNLEKLDYIRVLNYQAKVPEQELIDPEDTSETVTGGVDTIGQAAPQGDATPENRGSDGA